MMIDTHCHLGKDDYDQLTDVIDRMQDNIIIISGVDDKSNLEVLELCHQYSNVYGTLGIHPTELDQVNESSFSFIEKHIMDPKIVGIGEIGLDYYWEKDSEIKKRQQDIFIRQIKLANQYQKTVVIHSRESAEDTYNILKTYLHTKAVLHCYSYSLEMARRFLEMDLKLGIGGVLTFCNSIKLREVVKQLELDNFLLETDSPYLTPEPFRGKKNEPYNVYYVGQKMAEIKGISLNEVFDTTTKMAMRQFDLDV